MIKSFSTRLSVYILGITIALFVLSFSLYFNYSSSVLLREVLARQDTEVENLTSNIDAILSKVELSLKSVVFSINNQIEQRGDFADMQKNFISQSSAVYGAAIAFEPYYFDPAKHYYMQYTMHNDGHEAVTDMVGGADSYDYHAMDWYLIPKLKDEPYWSEPYFDAGLGGVAMTTYSVPLYDKNNEFIGVATADVSLEWITETIAEYKPYPQSYSFMLSKNAYYISHADKHKILNETFFTGTYDMHNETVAEIGSEMLAHKQGNREFLFNDDLRYAFYGAIERTGWSVGTVSFKSDIFMEINKVNRNFWLLIAGGLILIFSLTILVIRRATRPLEIFAKSADVISKGDFNAPLPEITSRDEMYKLREAFVNMQSSLKNYIDELQTTTKAQERIESELEIATKIQMGMLPTIFPPNPNLPDVDLYASLIPAKEVGGDLYDFFSDGDTLYFTVGDASGKGVPASLLMAVTSSLFRSVALHLKDPAKVLTSMNNAIAEKNDANMFITLFVGALNVRTGELLYSSAGHNAPVLVRDRKATFIETIPNLPLGVMPDIEFAAHSMSITPEDLLFLYSDGLTEAENSELELYSDARLLDELDGTYSIVMSREVLSRVMHSVHDFVKDNEQSDDLTMLAIKLKPYEMTTELIIKNEISELDRMAAFIEELGERMSLEMALVMNLNLALEEAVSNIILYAYPQKMGEEISIKCSEVNNSLIFTISDRGIEFDPTQMREVDITLSAEEREIGGLGIFLIRQIMDEVKYERIDDKNILTIKKNL